MKQICLLLYYIETNAGSQPKWETEKNVPNKRWGQISKNNNNKNKLKDMETGNLWDKRVQNTGDKDA